MAKFEYVLPRLVHAYEQGKLVPFMGAGMSSGACPRWDTFISNLEYHAAQATGYSVSEMSETMSVSEKMRRANAAVRNLKNAQSSQFPDYVRRALRTIEDEHPSDQPPKLKKVPEQTAILAEIWWPLLMTTNYDDWFYFPYANSVNEGKHSQSRSLEVLGRSPQDCYKVLYSLEASYPSILWALQGFVGGQHPDGEQALDSSRPLWRKELEAELVVGHQEYRQVLFNSLHFRRAFAEVFRNRSLWFLGTSLSEEYFLNLFGEVLETYGPNMSPHYAFVPKGQVDVEFMQERFGTMVVEFENFEEINLGLKKFVEEVNGAHSRVMRWDFSLNSSVTS